MYHQFFGLHEAPFAITPNPRFVFLSHQHEDALAHLRWGISQGGGGGFVQLTGEVGTGKTTICRLLLEQLPENCRAALILNPNLNPIELLQAICDELKISTRGAMTSQKKLVDRLNKYLLKAHAEGLMVVVIIDEAQNLSPESLEQLRLLTNLETDSQKLLQIILLGQPELRDLLARPDLRQLAQRITARYHLQSLNAEETAAYTTHRLVIAGSQINPFNAAAMKALFQASSGTPRLINIIAERSLLIAYAADQKVITKATVKQAEAEISGHDANTHVQRRSQANRGSGLLQHWMAWAALLLMVLTVGMGWMIWQGYPEKWNGSSNNSEVQQWQNITSDEPVQRSTTPKPIFETLDFMASWNMLKQHQQLPEYDIKSDTDCNRRLSRRLFCQSGRTTSQAIIKLGRPVIVECPQLNPGFVVAEFSPSQVTLVDLSGSKRLSLSEFERHWSGRYWDYWQIPAYVPEILEEAARGPAVIWIKQAASVAQPAYSGDVEDPYFGPSLKQWAISFQSAHGIQPDGVIGRDTLQHLERYSPGSF